VFEARSRQRPLLEVTVIQHGTQHPAFAGFEHTQSNFTFLFAKVVRQQGCVVVD
jgi:hypothetical protein